MDAFAAAEQMQEQAAAAEPEAVPTGPPGSIAIAIQYPAANKVLATTLELPKECVVPALGTHRQQVANAASMLRETFLRMFDVWGRQEFPIEGHELIAAAPPAPVAPPMANPLANTPQPDSVMGQSVVPPHDDE